MDYITTIEKKTYKKVEIEPFEENLKPLFKKFDNVSMRVRSTDISVYTDYDYSGTGYLKCPDKYEEIHQFVFPKEYKERFLQLMISKGMPMETKDNINYSWDCYQ